MKKVQRNQHVKEAILALDLQPIIVKILHNEEGKDWDLKKIMEVELEYKKFLWLTFLFPNQQIVPTKEVDFFWHTHILDTQKYFEDCQNTFGYFLHHFPYLGLRNKEDYLLLQQAFAVTKSLYHSEFGVEATGDSAESGCTAQGCSGTSCAASKSDFQNRRPTLLEYLQQ